MEQVYKLGKVTKTSNSGIYTTIYHCSSYLLLYEKEQWLNVSYE